MRADYPVYLYDPDDDWSGASLMSFMSRSSTPVSLIDNPCGPTFACSPTNPATGENLLVDSVLQMASDVEDTVKRQGCNLEDRSRLPAALSCLKSLTERGGDLRRNSPQHTDGLPAVTHSSKQQPTVSQGRSISISVIPCWGDNQPYLPSEEMFDAFSLDRNTPPTLRASKIQTPKTAHTQPPHSRKWLQLMPISTGPARSKSHDLQMVNRTEEPTSYKANKKNKAVDAIYINGNSLDDPSLHSPLLSARKDGPLPASAPYTMTAAPTPLDNLAVHRSSPHTLRRDIGLAVTHRFSTKSWLSQTCQVCGKNMIFGVKCKHCKFKCHNKCTRDVPSCRILFLTLPKIRRAESVPSDINNRIDHKAKIPLQFGTLPKAITKREPPVQVDSSSNPSSAASSTPSSPTHSQQSNPRSVSTTPPLNTSPEHSQDINFRFPDVPDSKTNKSQQSESSNDSRASQTAITETQLEGAEEDQKADEDHTVGDDQGKSFSNEDIDEDGLEDLPSPTYHRRTVGRWRGGINRKASQTSVYLQEWDIPYEELQLGELVGKGRWGKVFRGRWHGEVAIRLVEVDGNNQEHLKLFKKEVMNYRQTRHENVILFMGACMAPPHLAIVTSFCKGVPLYSFVRERGHLLDINNTRQIAQEIVKGMGYLHAKGIIHKDLKSKNVFYDSNRVVITDFGLFGMSGVVQEGRRESVLKIPQGWMNYLSPEIVRVMSPEVAEDQLPFSKAADVYAFGTIWYELHFRDWAITNQPVEAKIWLVGSNEGIKKVLANANLSKEVTRFPGGRSWMSWWPGCGGSK
ncbi:kinase suppressor of Ras 1-like isoform X2 [Syngnathoides biaculeatus]|uniref:kinase suppressor of Ras 1-like isoform X2 n=1 Tax=Syngnathoides biaculeatus TaxID=300417 RepID=UPI002ADDBC5F|nr:kinase suppressor of Ras 1-like isoform X2 [Syngnathoides biaculeatus]